MVGKDRPKKKESHMAKKFVTHQDKVIFQKNLLPVGMIKSRNETIIKAGNGKWVIQGKACCLQGDEGKVKLKAKYENTVLAAIPGTPVMGEGQFKIIPFAPGFPHLSKKHTIGGKSKIVQKGATKFKVQFIVSKPYKKILPPPAGTTLQDPVPIYLGQAHFVVKTNTKETEA